MSDDALYIKSVKTLIPPLREYFENMGVRKITSTIGYRKSLQLLPVGHQILKNINQQVTDKQKLEKDINTVLNIPSVREMIPQYIINTPEFSTIVGNHPSHH